MSFDDNFGEIVPRLELSSLLHIDENSGHFDLDHYENLIFFILNLYLISLLR